MSVEGEDDGVAFLVGGQVTEADGSGNSADRGGASETRLCPGVGNLVMGELVGNSLDGRPFPFEAAAVGGMVVDGGKGGGPGDNRRGPDAFSQGQHGLMNVRSSSG